MTLELLGYAGAILMGLSLGLIGGGGSILTVPILVYLFSVDAVLATAYSLFVVGLTSLIGSFSHMRLGNIHWRTAIVFGIPSIISVYLTRAYVVPAIPDPVFHLGNAAVSKAHAILLLFAVIMLLASYSMIRKRVVMENEEAEPRYNYPLILLEGIVVGAVTGLVGAGGGFLIIPALVLLAKLPMKQAVGTSLLIIAAKSLFGFLGDLTHYHLDWLLLGSVTILAIFGIFVGNRLSRHIDGNKLRKAFGWFVLVMGIYILARELFF